MVRKIQKKEDAGKRDFSFFAVVEGLISDLPKRSQEIIKKRFGLTGEKPRTLEKTGEIFGVTRERVRQIIMDSTKRIAQKNEEESFRQAQSEIFLVIHENSGIIKETEIVEKLSRGDNRESNALKLFVYFFRNILFLENEKVENSWALNQELIAQVEKVSFQAEEILRRIKKPLPEETFLDKISQELKMEGFSRRDILNFLKVLKKIKRNNFGKWGIHDWKEINPRGTREKIYAILKEKGQPLHFSQIARLIDEHKLGKRKAHPQTIHNELIKNEQFVLIGRGIYALKEWGYSKGTVKDVLKRILVESPKALAKEEILDQVLKVRKVKKTTILINLNDEKIFAKENNRYLVKKD